MLSFNQVQPLFKQVKSEAARVFPDAEIRVTGQYPLILLAQGKLLRGLIVSLSVTLLCVALVFRLLLRSTRLTLRVLVPNLWPVALVLGGMGWLNVPPGQRFGNDSFHCPGSGSGRHPCTPWAIISAWFRASARRRQSSVPWSVRPRLTS